MWSLPMVFYSFITHLRLHCDKNLYKASYKYTVSSDDYFMDCFCHLSMSSQVQMLLWQSKSIFANGIPLTLACQFHLDLCPMLFVLLFSLLMKITSLLPPTHTHKKGRRSGHHFSVKKIEGQFYSKIFVTFTLRTAGFNTLTQRGS